MAETIEYALMAGASYVSTRSDINRFPVPQGWTPVVDPPHFQDDTTGFEAIAFTNGTEIVISFAGTNPKDVDGDWVANAGLATGAGSNQIRQAVDYYLTIKAQAPADAIITFTGHSLGGGLAALMGVFFHCQAVTFDQAPFANSARTLTATTPDGGIVVDVSVAKTMRDYLAATAESTARNQLLSAIDDFLAQRSVLGGSAIPNASLVSNINLHGQFLEWPVLNGFSTIGRTVEDINPGASGLSGVQLHDIGLLSAFKLNDGFRQAALKLTDLLAMVFDEQLFAVEDLNTSKTNLLEHLLRHQIGVRDPATNTTTLAADAMLDRFTADLLKVASTPGFAASGDRTDALIAFAMQAYYSGPNATDATKQLYTVTGGGLQFERSNVADSLGQAKGYSLYFEKYIATLPEEVKTELTAKLENLLDWYLGGEYLSAEAKDKAAFMLGAANTDKLTGGSQADLLAGLGGNDFLDGRGGDDTLVGGDGTDLYLYKVGDGNDKIVDSDKKGRVLIVSTDSTKTYNASVFTKNKTNPNEYLSPDEQVKLVNNGTSWQLQAGGGTLTINDISESELANFGIHLRDYAEEMGEVNPTNTVTGDQNDSKQDSLSGTAAGDLIDGLSDNDTLYGAAGNDHLLGGDGNDTLYGHEDDDLLEGNDGNDRLDGSTGKDKLVGGKGTDILLGRSDDDVLEGGDDKDLLRGDAGEDRLYADTETDLAAAIAGQGGSPTNEKGDWLDGNDDDDTLVGGNGNDALMGGTGDDVIVGGVGDDLLEGDTETTYVSADWTVTRKVEPGENVTTYKITYELLDLQSAPLQGGADVLYGGVGEDWILAGKGDDWADGGSDNDVVLGQDGADVVSGGGGDDVVDGDVAGDTDGTAHGNDTVFGNGGSDKLWGSGGDDALFGGDDNDKLYGDSIEKGGYGLPGRFHGKDGLYGEDGDDHLWGMGSDDVLIGGDGADHLEGDYDPAELDGQFHGSDILDGGDGADVLLGLGGNDVLIGGEGDDVLAGDQADNAQLDVQYQGDDYLDGGAGNDYLTGHGGNDTLIGGKGDDTLHGDEGNDTLIGGTGIDRLEGGSGNDRYELSAGDGQAGADGVVDSGGDDTLAIGGSVVDLWIADGGLLAIQFGSNDVVVVDNEGVDIEHYELGGETASYAQLIGRYSADAVSGVDQQGQGHATGGYDADALVALDGNATLSGGQGDDTLTGAGGGNSYLYSAGDGNDTITDTSHASGVTTANRLVFGSGITSNDVDLYRNGTNLFARLATGEQITVNNQFASGGAIDTIQFSDGATWDAAAMASRTTLELTGAADTYAGTSADDRVSGLAGNDTINGGAGNDTLSGGAGNDTLSGGLGSDTYIFNLGDGVDQVNENGDATSVDVLRFGAGIAASGIAASGVRVVARPGSHMTFYVGSESIAFRYAMSAGSEAIKGIERVEFADGATWDYMEILRRSAEDSATTGNDIIYGFDGAETMHGLAGNDTLYGRGGDDQLYGEDGTDTLDGGDGSDTLDGGTGNDTLTGGTGSDVYLFARGGGMDTINNNDASTDKIDAIQFAADIVPTDVKVTRSGDYLVLAVAGTSDQVMVDGYFINDATGSYKLEEIRFADGTVWSVDMVKAQAIAGTAGSDTLYGYATDDTMDGLASGDWLYGRAGNDTLRGGADNDYLYGEAGDDLLDGGVGDDQLSGGAGNDTFLFRRTSGSDTIACDDTSTATVDAVIHEADVAPTSVQVGHFGNNLTLTLGSLNALTLSKYFANDGAAAVDEIRFADGTIWRHDELRARLLNGGSGADVLSGFDADDTMVGGDGNDALSGGAGNDSLDGGSGNDSLYGEAGNDTLFGSAGNDTMDGGAGDDVYRFGRGDGQDTITEHWTVSAMDTLELGAGVTPDDVGLYRNGNDLIVVLDNSSTQMKVKDFYLGSAYQIEKIRFADATEWDAAAIAARTISGTANAMTGTAGNDMFVVDNAGDTITEGANQGADTVQSSVSWTLGANLENLTLTGAVNIDGTGNTLDNMIVGNSGNNVLKGGGGVDTLRGGVGDDTYDIQQGTNTVVELAGEGNDTVKFNSNYVLADNLENAIIGGYWNSPYKFYLTGNGLDNVIQSRVGDVIDGGVGADTMIFSTGLGSPGTYFPAYEIAGSTAYVDNPGDIVIGADASARIVSSIDYVLGVGVGQLELAAGSAAIFGTGNGLNNFIKGNEQDNVLAGLDGDDTFYGGSGRDTFVGGRGNDVYHLDTGKYYNSAPYVNPYLYQVLQAEDTVVELDGEGTDTIYSIYDYVLGDHLENLVLGSFSGNTGSMIGTYYAISGTGNSLDNILTGNAGNNTLDGKVGADTMKGGHGSDTYYVDNAGDQVIEESSSGGIDSVYSQVSFTLGQNVESLILSGAGNDVGTGNALNNTLDGSQGAGANQLIGGLGDDTYVLGTGDTIVELAGEGNDTVVTDATCTLAGSRIENITLAGSATIDATGNELDNVLAGNMGNNRLDGGAGNDTYRFGRGSGQDIVVDGDVTAGNLDKIVFNTGIAVADILLSRSGDDLVAAIAGTSDQITIEGQFSPLGYGLEELRFDDLTTVWTRTDIARMVNNQAPVVASLVPDQSASEGSAFSYTVSSGAFSDPDAGDTLTYTATLADGSALPSWLAFNSTTRVFSGTPPMGSSGVSSIKIIATDAGGLVASDLFDLTITVQNLTLNGTSTANTLTAGGGNDTLNGLGGNDTLYGYAGNDTLDGGTGSDKMYGGLGDDIYVVNVSTDTVSENTNEGIDTVKSAVTLTLGNNVENLTLTGTSAISGTGTTLDNVLTGNSATNTLTGGAGNDTIDGGSGSDTMVGGAGNDTYFVNVSTDKTTENANEGTDTVKSSVALTLGNNLENLTLTGTSAINGTGNALNNVLVGNSTNNTLTGNAGNDTLDGSAGVDSLVGGAGNDTYVLGRGYGADTVTENDATAGNMDIASFLAGIGTDQIWFRHVGTALEVSVIGTSDKLTISNWYSGNQYHVEQFKTADGLTLLDSQVENLVQAMASFAPPAAGQTTLPPTYQDALGTTIAANWQ